MRSLLVAILGVFLLADGLVSTSEAQRRRPTKKKPTKKKPAPKSKIPQPGDYPRSRTPTVAKVTAGTISSVLQSARKIDDLVEAGLKRAGQSPNPDSSDEVFVRRVYLDITGSVPSLLQTKRFLLSRSPNKRQLLVDTLLNSYGYVSHYYNYWGDVLRLQDRPNPNIYAAGYNEWVKASLVKNTAYDQWVREMISASGKISENPASGYMLRDTGMPLNHLSNTVRVFLGTQIGCAQCHDHPFDRWKQKEFYQLAAFLYPTNTRLNRGSPGMRQNFKKFQEVSNDIRKNVPRRDSGLARRIMRTNLYSLHDLPYRKLRYPHDYAYKDAKPKQVVQPKTLFGPAAYITAGKTPRQAFGEWLTSRQNPRFTKAIVNRMWKKVMGVGLIDPIDDIKDDSVSANPPLMKFLMAEMQRVNFNLKEFLRILHNTKTYQRQASAQAPNPEKPYLFPGPTLRRMKAEQVWDSFLTLAMPDPNGYKAPSSRELYSIINFDLKAMPTRDAIVSRATKFRDYTGKITRAKKKPFLYKGQLLARASELPLPAPAGHFLRQFGQGDRELIQGSNEDGSVTQVLAMFNGPITHMLLEQGSEIYNNVVRAKTVNERIDVIFMSILSRKPTSGERRFASQEIRKGGNGGYGNVIWALVNTREFLFIQ